MKNVRKGSEKGCLRLFLSLSSDKSFNWAHIFKIPAFFLHSRKKIRSSNAAKTFFLRFNVKIPAAPKKDLFLKNEDFFADIQLSRFWRENSLKFKNIYNISKCFCQQLPLTASVIFRVNGFPIWSYYIRMPDKKSLEMTPYLPKETVCQIADSCSLDDCHFDSGSFFEPENNSVVETISHCCLFKFWVEMGTLAGQFRNWILPTATKCKLLHFWVIDLWPLRLFWSKKAEKFKVWSFFIQWVPIIIK